MHQYLKDEEFFPSYAALFLRLLILAEKEKKWLIIFLMLQELFKNGKARIAFGIKNITITIQYISEDKS